MVNAENPEREVRDFSFFCASTTRFIGSPAKTCVQAKHLCNVLAASAGLCSPYRSSR
jgi:hypothetical protein